MRGIDRVSLTLLVYAFMYLVVGTTLLLNDPGYSRTVYQEVVFDIIPRQTWGWAFLLNAIAVFAVVLAVSTERYSRRKPTCQVFMSVTTAVLAALWSWWLLMGYLSGLIGVTAVVFPLVATYSIMVIVRAPER
jgi:hypothetical protein